MEGTTKLLMRKNKFIFCFFYSGNTLFIAYFRFERDLWHVSGEEINDKIQFDTGIFVKALWSARILSSVAISGSNNYKHWLTFLIIVSDTAYRLKIRKKYSNSDQVCFPVRALQMRFSAVSIFPAISSASTIFWLSVERCSEKNKLTCQLWRERSGITRDKIFAVFVSSHRFS